MSERTILTAEVTERTTRFITATVRTPADAAYTPSTLTLLLYEPETGLVINGRERVSILDANGGTITDGVLELELSPADNAIVAPRAGKTSEVHRALIEWTWANGKAGSHEIEYTVVDHQKR